MQVRMLASRLITILVWAFLPTAATAAPQFVSVEPNNSKAEATPAFGIVDSGTLHAPPVGFRYDRNVFRVRPAALTPGIYRHALTISPSSGPTQLRLLGRDATVDSVYPDSVSILADTRRAVPFNPTVAWYGFGQAEEVYAELNSLGVVRSAPGSSAVFTTEAVTPVDLGALPSPTAQAVITIQVGDLGQRDSELFLYDADYRLVYQGWSDNNGVFEGTPSLHLPLHDGTYYVAVADKGLAGHLPTGEDQSEFQNPTDVTDFQGALVAGGLAPAADYQVTVRLPGLVGTLSASISRPGPLSAAWATFTIGNSQDTFAFCPGDGTLAPCPCANESIGRSGAGCLNSTGRGGTLIQAPRRYQPTASNFVACDLPPFAATMIFASLQPQTARASFGGLMCVDPGAARLPITFADKAGYAITRISVPNETGFLSGATVYTQSVYRDPEAAAGCQVNVTSGTAFVLK